MEVLISLGIPSADGKASETYVVCEDLPTPSEMASLSMAIEMVDGALWHSDVRGVRRVSGSTAASPLLPGEKYLTGGMAAAVALMRERDPSRKPSGYRY